MFLDFSISSTDTPATEATNLSVTSSPDRILFTKSLAGSKYFLVKKTCRLSSSSVTFPLCLSRAAKLYAMGSALIANTVEVICSDEYFSPVMYKVPLIFSVAISSAKLSIFSISSSLYGFIKELSNLRSRCKPISTATRFTSMEASFFWLSGARK